MILTACYRATKFNIMSVPLLNKLNNKPQRNGFDLSRRTLFTADAGMLHPVFVEDCLPGDHFKINVNALTRTEQLNTAAFARINEHYDFFFVPYRLLWRFFPDWLVENKNLFFNYRNSSGSILNSLPAGLPRINLKDVYNAFAVSTDISKDWTNKYDSLGYPYIIGAHRLYDMLGYGRMATPDRVDTINGFFGSAVSADVYVSPFRLLAYQKIYQDFYRNYLWENPSPTTCNIDYVDSSYTNGIIPFSNYYDTIRSFGQIRYADYKKDYFLGVYPNTQYGDVALASVVTDSISSIDGTSSNGALYRSSAGEIRLGNATGKVQELEGSLSVLDLRKAEALQRYKEVTQANKYGYDPQIKAHFGVNVPNGLGNYCTFIDGFENPISIGEEVGTSENNLGVVGGKATGIENGNKTIEFNCNEHGILMGLYYIEPNVDYDSIQLDRFNRKLDFEDFYMPEFANIGLQPVYASEGYFPMSQQTDGTSSIVPINQLLSRVIGYGVRYGEYKSRVDKVYGDFNETRKVWAIPYDFTKSWDSQDDTLLTDFRRFKINPAILNPIFAGEFGSYGTGVADPDEGSLVYYAGASDRFLINSYWDVKAVRNMSVDGMPF